MAGVRKRRERGFSARGAREEGGRGTPARTLLFVCVINIHQMNVKILIGQSSKHVNDSLNTLIRLVEINITPFE